MTTTITSTDVVSGIVFGMFDDDLDRIAEALKARREAKRELLVFTAGDNVVFNTRTHPVYMQGIKAVVTGVKRTKVVVKISEDHGRFHAGAAITTSPDLLDMA